MATSTNYLWTEPNDSDLVKNGASAIRTLGNAIDTSLWNSGFGQAGKNKIINADFKIWQRGTSFTITTSTLTYTADRWYSHILGATVGCTVSQQTFTPATAPVAGYEGQYFIRQNVTTLTSQSIQALGQRIEDVRTFAGQTVTLSFWAKADSSRNYTSRFVQNFGSGGSSEVVTSTGATHALTTSWQRFTVSVAVPSLSGKTIGTSSYLAILIDGPSNTANTLDVFGVQLEYGSVATPFQTATATLQGELAACQRYFEKSFAQATTPASNATRQGAADFFAVRAAGGLTVTTVRFAVLKRTSTPTMTYYNPLAAGNQMRNVDTASDCTSTTTDDTSEGSFRTYATLPVASISTNAIAFNWTASAEL